MKHTILLIEDDPIAVKMGELILNHAGYRVVSALNGLQGLKKAYDLPDLILLDLMLPGMDGFEILSRLRADPKTAEIPVLILSAKGRDSDIEMASKMGANGYMTKPYERTRLLSTLQSLLSQKAETIAQKETSFPGSLHIAIVSPHGHKATSLTLHAGVALASKGLPTTVIDFHPFSTEHASLLGISSSIMSILLSKPGIFNQLEELAVRHPSGLRLLHNLEGSGRAGQFIPQDAQQILDALPSETGFVLADVPLYPADLFNKVAERCHLILLVMGSDPASLETVRATYTRIQPTGISQEQIRLILIGPEAKEIASQFGRAVLSTLPSPPTADDPALHALVSQLQTWAQSQGVI